MSTPFQCPFCNHEIPNNTQICPFCGGTLTEKKPMSMSHISFLLITLLVIFFGAFFLFSPKEEKMTPSEKKVHDSIVKQSNIINKALPLTLDSETRLDTTSVIGKNTLQYEYTLVNIEKSQINIQEYQQQLQENVFNNLKENTQMLDLMKQGVDAKYVYSDKNGVELFKLDFSSSSFDQ